MTDKVYEGRVRRAFIAPSLIVLAATIPYIWCHAPIFPFAALLVSVYLNLSLKRQTAEQAQTIRKLHIEETSLRERAQKAERRRNEFLANISHEIRTLMNGIIGFTDLALKKDLAGELRDYLWTVRTSADWLMRIINDILDFSRLEAGRLPIEKSDFAFAESLRTTIAIAQPTALEKSLLLAYKIDPEIPRIVYGDKDRIFQIVLNLLDNAVKFTTSGSVALTASLMMPGEKEFIVRISVADTGIGIAPEWQKRIGEAGLGLAICSKLALLMGGQFEVQSQLGAGSTFHLTIPLEPGRGNATQPAVGRVLKRQTPRLSVLLVEDDRVSRRLATKLLESSGHQVTPAGTGREAISLFASEIFDLILMDLHLPDLTGFEVTELIRKSEPEDCHVAIYAMTASAETHDRQKCLAVGMDGYLAKPIDINQVLELVTNLASCA